VMRDIETQFIEGAVRSPIDPPVCNDCGAELEEEVFCAGCRPKPRIDDDPPDREIWEVR